MEDIYGAQQRLKAQRAVSRQAPEDRGTIDPGVLTEKSDHGRRDFISFADVGFVITSAMLISWASWSLLAAVFP